MTSGTLRASSCSAEQSAHGSTGRRMWGLLTGETRYESRLLVKAEAQAGKSGWSCRTEQYPARSTGSREAARDHPSTARNTLLPQALQCSTSWFNLIWVFSRQAKIQAHTSFCQFSHKARQLEALTPQAIPGNRFAAVYQSLKSFCPGGDYRHCHLTTQTVKHL